MRPPCRSTSSLTVLQKLHYSTGAKRGKALQVRQNLCPVICSRGRLGHLRSLHLSPPHY